MEKSIIEVWWSLPPRQTLSAVSLRPVVDSVLNIHRLSKTPPPVLHLIPISLHYIYHFTPFFPASNFSFHVLSSFVSVFSICLKTCHSLFWPVCLLFGFLPAVYICLPSLDFCLLILTLFCRTVLWVDVPPPFDCKTNEPDRWHFFLF